MPDIPGSSPRSDINLFLCHYFFKVVFFQFFFQIFSIRQHVYDLERENFIEKLKICVANLNFNRYNL